MKEKDVNIVGGDLIRQLVKKIIEVLKQTKNKTGEKYSDSHCSSLYQIHNYIDEKLVNQVRQNYIQTVASFYLETKPIKIKHIKRYQMKLDRKITIKIPF